MFTALEAEQLIFTLVTPIDAEDPAASETIDISLARQSVECLGRILSAPVCSALDFPHWDNSAMDGYAVRAADVQQVPTTLDVIEEIPAGQPPQKSIDSGQAARILTGAMMPTGADTVVMQENTTRDIACDTALDRMPNANRVTILKSPQPRSFVRHQGHFYQSGNELLPVGQVVSPAEIALLAAAQQTQVNVYRRVRVAILSTGNELRLPVQALNPGQIVDSNQYALCALVAQANAIPIPLGIVSDDRAAVKAAITQALTQADIVLSTGGVSVGDYDYVDDVLSELGATLHIRSVAVKPGKPLTVASFDRGQTSLQAAKFLSQQPLYFGLPGNPASAMVGFWRFVAPAIAKLSGQPGPWSPNFVWATAKSDLRAGGQRETYLWGQLNSDEGGFSFTNAAGSHSSGNLVNLVSTSGLGVVPQGETLIKAGQSVRVLKIR
ncbi:MAG: gephyrin-like molybdotransferase Glp [Cyanobacteria bacterium J06621_11]